MKDKLAKHVNANNNNSAATTTKMTTEKKGENKAGAASTPPSPSPVVVVIKGGKNATTSLSPTGTLRGYWQAEEETALRAAVQKHGIGAWEKMRTDPDFKALRCARYIFYRERRATDCFSSRFFQVLLVVFSFSRFLVVVFVLCAVMMRETQTRQFQFPATRGGRAGDKKTKKLSSSSSFAMKFPQNVLWEHFFPNNNNTVSSLSSSSSSSSRLSKKFVFRDGEEEVKEEEVKEESCCCCCLCVFECGSFRWLGDLVVVVVKVESSSVASNLSQKTTFKINAGLSSFTFPKFQGKNRSAAER